MNQKKHTKTKPNLKPTPKFNNCSHVCAYHCVQLSYTTQHNNNSSDNFSSYPPDNRHCSDDVYWRGEGEMHNISNLIQGYI